MLDTLFSHYTSTASITSTDNPSPRTPFWLATHIPLVESIALVPFLASVTNGVGKTFRWASLVGTHTAIYAETDDVSRFGDAIRSFLETSHPGEDIVSATDTRMPIYGDMFRFVDVPTVFAYAACPVNWCTAHFNCFAHLESLANSLSTLLNTQVVVLNIQTVSSCYYVSVHRNGHQTRAFNFEDGEHVLDVGPPLDFESDDFPDPEKCGNDFDAYCDELGLPIGTRENFAAEWSFVQLSNQPPKRQFTAPAQPAKPWWKRILGGP